MSLHRNIRYDLIEKELASPKPYAEFHQFKPTNRMIDWLFRRYKLEEMTEHWYDEEPDFLWITDSMEFNNWIDVIGDGIWHHTQKSAERVAKQTLKHVRSCGMPRKDRFYIAISKDNAYVYWYGRDGLFRDYWWVFSKRK